MYWDILALSFALAWLIEGVKSWILGRRRGKTWVELSYYAWVRAVRRGERTTTSRNPADGQTRYWTLE